MLVVSQAVLVERARTRRELAACIFGMFVFWGIFKPTMRVERHSMWRDASVQLLAMQVSTSAERGRTLRMRAFLPAYSSVAVSTWLGLSCDTITLNLPGSTTAYMVSRTMIWRCHARAP